LRSAKVQELPLGCGGAGEEVVEDVKGTVTLFGRYVE
jgi:hypothetical protein